MPEAALTEKQLFTLMHQGHHVRGQKKAKSVDENRANISNIEDAPTDRYTKLVLMHCC